MVVDGKRVTVGAFGTAEKLEGPTVTAIPGTYAQVLTVEFGRFAQTGFEEPKPPLTFSFGMLGEHNVGLMSETPPNCATMGAFSHQLLPSGGGEMWLSPSITSPVDGSVNHTGAIKFSGAAEPGATIAV